MATITRRGFRKAPADVTKQAEAILADAFAGDQVLAELRRCSYCGPDSAGARGAYILSATGRETGFGLFTIEREEVAA